MHLLPPIEKNHKDGTFEINLEYITCPDLNNGVLVLVDPMLATGASIIKTLDYLSEYGKFSQLHIVSVLASSYGIKTTSKAISKSTHLDGSRR